LADPARFVRNYSFNDFQSVQPNTPLPGIQVDVQLDAISDSTTQIRDAILDIRRSDGALVNGIVTTDSLEAGLLDELLATSQATAAAASATAAAASAADAESSASAIDVAAGALEAASNAFATGGIYVDWGDFHSVPGTSLDWGSFH